MNDGQGKVLIIGAKRKISQPREIFTNYSHLNFTCDFLNSVTLPLYVINMYTDILTLDQKM